MEKVYILERTYPDGERVIMATYEDPADAESDREEQQGLAEDSDFTVIISRFKSSCSAPSLRERVATLEEDIEFLRTEVLRLA